MYVYILCTAYRSDVEHMCTAAAVVDGRRGKKQDEV